MIEYSHQKEQTPFTDETEVQTMKGYHTANGYYGLVGSDYVLFSDETDYFEYMDEEAA